MLLLDADVMTDIIRGHRAALIWFAMTDDELGIPGPVILELMSGCQNRREMERLRSLLAPFSVY